MTKKSTLAKEIVEELVKLKDLTPSQIMEGDDFGLPRLINAGTEGSFLISKLIDEKISALADVLKLARPALKKTVRDQEWRSWVRNEIGPISATIDLTTSSEDWGVALLALLEPRLDSRVAGLKDREHGFGATIFGNTDIPRFSIGPVTIEPVEDWLIRKGAEGYVTSTTARRVRAAWAGKTLAKRKAGTEAMVESDILEATRNYPYVVSVRLGGFGSAAGLETAAEAARLALVTIALVWARPSSAMRGFRLNFDGPIYHQIAMTFVPGRGLLAGSSLHGLPAGPRIELKAWAKAQRDFDQIFDAAGTAIQHRVSPDQASSRAGVMNALAQALFWFHAGCTQGTDAVAVVYFSSCLDALSGGLSAKGIVKLIETRLGVKGSDPINTGGPTYRSVIETIFNEGRSRTVHGTSVKVGHDWSRSRSLAEQLARLALVSCLDKVGGDVSLTDTDALSRA